MHVLCEVEVAHGDVRASGAEHGIAVSKAQGAYLSVFKGIGEGRLVALVGERHKEFVGVAEQYLIITADGNSSFLQPSLEILRCIASEGCVELGLLEQRCAAGHIQLIRNHDFARYGTKGFIFKAFRVFSKAFHEMLKKETENSSLKNANLCLAFGWEHFIFINCFCGRAFFFDYRDALFEG